MNSILVQWPSGFLEYITLVNLLFQMFVFLLKSFDRLVESFPLDFAICADWNCWEGDFRHWMRRRLDWHENWRLLPLTPKAGDKVGSKKHPDASNDCPQNSKTTIQFWTYAICFELRKPYLSAMQRLYSPMNLKPWSEVRSKKDLVIPAMSDRSFSKLKGLN